MNSLTVLSSGFLTRPVSESLPRVGRFVCCWKDIQKLQNKAPEATARATRKAAALRGRTKSNRSEQNICKATQKDSKLKELYYAAENKFC